MGNWNRRYIPSRKRYRHYDYEDPNPPFDDFSNVSGTHNNNVPQWEIDYCKSVRVPWRKVVASKKYGYCYPSVQEWDDSLGEEALNNAKQRYWASINGIQCEIPLPDPNMYIDEVDWNTTIDPKLMAELDRAFHDDDHKGQSFRKLATIAEEIGMDQSGNDNPWEVDRAGDDGVILDGWGWRVDSQNTKSSSPWEQNCDRPVDSWKDSGWGSGNNSWDQRVDLQNTKKCNLWEQSCDRPVDSWNNYAWESGMNSRDRRVDSQKQINRDWNFNQVADSWNASAWEIGNISWDINEETLKPCRYTNWNPRFRDSYAYPRNSVPVKRGWRQRDTNSWNRNAQDQDLRFNNYRNNKWSADVKDRGWRGRDNKTWVRRGSGWNRGGSFQVHNNGD